MRALGLPMELFDLPTDFADRWKDELPISERCLKELKKIRADLAKVHERTFELFDIGLNIGYRSERTLDGKLTKLTEAAIWHSVLLKTEFKLKLLYTIDGYLSAVEAKNPVSTFLLARYLLELVATVHVIDAQLERCFKIDAGEWENRALNFIAILFRSRHSTSHPDFRADVAELGISEVLVKPVRIVKAVQQLAGRSGFSGAVSMYDFLSNICHHNGSGHRMFTESFRETTAIALPSGRAVFRKETAVALTMRYPARASATMSYARTARIAWYSAHIADRLIGGLAERPFTREEIRHLTNGRLKDISIDTTERLLDPLQRKKIAKVGRNDPCSCGSGKKFKLCCGKEAGRRAPGALFDGQ